MFLIYWKGKVGYAVARLCDFQDIPYEIRDDQDGPVNFAQYEAIIPSPWVPSTHPVHASGKVIGELDFVSRVLPEQITTIAITGTDGKSSTAWITYSILKHEFSVKKVVYLGGNFDIPLSDIVREILEKGIKKWIIVIEVSSFMAHTLREFQPDYTIFTNFKPDHIDWHQSLEAYFRAKWNLITQTKKTVILHESILEEAEQYHVTIPDRTRIFGACREKIEERLKDCTDWENIKISGRAKYHLSDTNFSGMHNALNILSAGILANELGICAKHVRNFLPEITGLPHRIEFVTEKNGIRYIDDSKSTSSQSMRAGLGAFPHEMTILIAGWYDKGDPFDDIEKDLVGVKYAVLIGQTRELLAEKCRLANVPFVFAESMQEAVALARHHAKRWDTILLSPGCASFGMFRDYLDRAEKFREAIVQER